MSIEITSFGDSQRTFVSGTALMPIGTAAPIWSVRAPDIYQMGTISHPPSFIMNQQNYRNVIVNIETSQIDVNVTCEMMHEYVVDDKKCLDPCPICGCHPIKMSAEKISFMTR